MRLRLSDGNLRSNLNVTGNTSFIKVLKDQLLSKVIQSDVTALATHLQSASMRPRIPRNPFSEILPQVVEITNRAVGSF